MQSNQVFPENAKAQNKTIQEKNTEHNAEIHNDKTKVPNTKY